MNSLEQLIDDIRESGPVAIGTALHAVIASDLDELELEEEDHLAAIATQRRRIRSLYRAARRALDLARVYVEETAELRGHAKRSGLRFEDHRVRGCVLEVRAYRLSIRSLRRSL